MGAPLLWAGNRARLLKPSLQIPGSTSGNIVLSAPATISVPYTITLPPAQGSSGQTLLNDGAGNLSWGTAGGSLAVTTFPIANNQVAPANVTGFLVNSASQQAFSAEVSVRRAVNTPGSAVSNGSLNAAFDANAAGLITNTFDTVFGSAVDSLGRVVFVGNFSVLGYGSVKIMRLDQDGNLDAAFMTALGTGADAQINCVHIDSSNNIFIGGRFDNFNGNPRSKIAKLDSAGALLPFAASVVISGGVGTTEVRSIATKSNGEVLVGGDFTSVDIGLTPFTTNHFFVFNPSATTGPPLPTFIDLGFNERINDIFIDSSDNVYFGGQFTQYNSNTHFKVLATDQFGVELSGLVLPAGPTFEVTRVRLDSLGRVSVVGNIALNFLGDAVPVYRFLASRADDTTFNANIFAVYGAGYTPISVNALATQGDNKVVVGGRFGTPGTDSTTLARFNADGTLDTAFMTTIGGGLYRAASPILPIQTISKRASDDLFFCGGTLLLLYGPVLSPVTLAAPNIALLGSFTAPSLEERYQQLTLKGVYRPNSADWEIASGTAVGVATGVNFSMTALGQLQYTSDNLVGTPVVSEMKFTIIGL